MTFLLTRLGHVDYRQNTNYKLRSTNAAGHIRQPETGVCPKRLSYMNGTQLIRGNERGMGSNW